MLSPVDYLLIGADATVITLFLRAGAAKLVSPNQAAAAIGELGDAARGAATAGFVRGLAALELVTAIALAFPWLSRPAHLLAGVFGIVFAAAGVLGIVRGGNAPCGCFGTQSTKPLGPANVLLGLAFLAAAALSLAMPVLPQPVAPYVPLCAVVLSIGGLFGTHRRRARIVLGRFVNRSEVAA